MEDGHHMEENIAKFGEKLKQLVAHGKKNKSILELQEINDFFSDMELDAEQMEKVYEYTFPSENTSFPLTKVRSIDIGNVCPSKGDHLHFDRIFSIVTV